MAIPMDMLGMKTRDTNNFSSTFYNFMFTSGEKASVIQLYRVLKKKKIALSFTIR